MRKKIDPKTISLHHSTCLEKARDNEFIIVINRKSRVVMKDGKTILQKAKKITTKFPGALVKVESTAPVCSKTKSFLKDNQIDIYEK